MCQANDLRNFDLAMRDMNIDALRTDLLLVHKCSRGRLGYVISTRPF